MDDDREVSDDRTPDDDDADDPTDSAATVSLCPRVEATDRAMTRTKADTGPAPPGQFHRTNRSKGEEPRRWLGYWPRLERSGSRLWLSIKCSETGAQVDHRLGVDLTDPGLGHPEHLADLLQCEVLVVIESENNLFALGK